MGYKNGTPHTSTPRLAVMPSPLISQADLGEVEFLRSEARRIRKSLEALGSQLAGRLERGAAVEPGALTVEWEERRNAFGESERVLLVNGRRLGEL